MTTSHYAMPRATAGCYPTLTRVVAVVATPGLQGRGKVTSAPIPAPASGFTARIGKIYLPPAYFADPRPRLPVLVLLAGQPGTPQDWLSAGKLARIMDRFAADHHGLAPVVVVADDTGSRFGNPLCLDSRRGEADTYLAGMCLPG